MHKINYFKKHFHKYKKRVCMFFLFVPRHLILFGDQVYIKSFLKLGIGGNFYNCDKTYAYQLKICNEKEQC